MWEAFAVQKLFSFFSTTNISITGYKVVKHLTSWPLNELVKLTMLWTTWPWIVRSSGSKKIHQRNENSRLAYSSLFMYRNEMYNTSHIQCACLLQNVTKHLYPALRSYMELDVYQTWWFVLCECYGKNMWIYFFFLMYPRSLWRPRVPSEKSEKKK